VVMSAGGLIRALGASHLGEGQNRKKESEDMGEHEEQNNGGTYGKIIVKGLLALLVAVGPAVVTFYIGRSQGSVGKDPGFNQIPTQVKLDKTKWEVKYEDINPSGPGKFTPVERAAIIEFSQVGSRITGKGSDTTGRQWIIEGATAERRVCYIYYDTGGQRLSFGTVIVEMDGPGVEMTGQWTGWSPESNQPQPRKVTLRKIT
jgi:hypothetical protein